MSDSRTDIEVTEPNDSDAAPECGKPPEQLAHEKSVRLSRDEMMARIAERRNAQIERELQQAHAQDAAANPQAGRTQRGDALDPVPGADDIGASNPSEDAFIERERQRQLRAEQQPPEPHAANVPRPAAEASQLRTVEIDGHTFQVTQQQYDELARMGVRANVAISQAQRQLATAQTARMPPSSQGVSQRPAAVPTAPPISRELAEEYADRIQYGGKDAVAEALSDYGQRLVAAAQAQSVSPQAVVQLVGLAQRAAMQQQAEQIQLQRDIGVIEREYPEIAQRQELGEFAAVQLAHVRQEDQAAGRTRSNLESYRLACERVMAMLGRNGAFGRGNGSSTYSTERSPTTFERKREAPRQPSGVNRRALMPEGSRSRTGSEIVREMMVARGQVPRE